MIGKMTKNKWLEMNGFSDFGVTYLVLGNSYPIKDDLKENGFKYSPLLRWHGDNDDLDLPKDCSYYEIRYEDIFIWDEESQTTFMKEGIREKLDLIFNPIVESNSQFVGEIGERLRDISVLVHNIGGYNSAYGYRWVYTFEDESGNRYSWFTTSQQAVSIGMKVILTGTVKAHVEYKGAETTQLKNCVLKNA